MIITTSSATPMAQPNPLLPGCSAPSASASSVNSVLEDGSIGFRLSGRSKGRSDVSSIVSLSCPSSGGSISSLCSTGESSLCCSVAAASSGSVRPCSSASAFPSSSSWVVISNSIFEAVGENPDSRGDDMAGVISSDSGHSSSSSGCGDSRKFFTALKAWLQRLQRTFPCAIRSCSARTRNMVWQYEHWVYIVWGAGYSPSFFSR